MLTQKEETFARLKASGATSYDAYREAYSTTTEVRGTVDHNASVLSSKVATRITELKTAIVEKSLTPAVADLTARLEHASRVMESPSASLDTQLRANRLIGEYGKDLGASSGDSYTTTNNVFVNWPGDMLVALRNALADGSFRAFAEALSDGSWNDWLAQRQRLSSAVVDVEGGEGNITPLLYSGEILPGEDPANAV